MGLKVFQGLSSQNSLEGQESRTQVTNPEITVMAMNYDQQRMQDLEWDMGLEKNLNVSFPSGRGFQGQCAQWCEVTLLAAESRHQPPPDTSDASKSREETMSLGSLATSGTAPPNVPQLAFSELPRP